MGDKTGIEWTDATWNPTVGCTIVSPGCTNCYAMKMAGRIEAMTMGENVARSEGARLAPIQTHYAGTTKASKAGSVWTGKLALAPERILTQPLRWRRQRQIFVNSMSDLFHESVPDEWIDRVFAVMAMAPQHTFQVLTKRSGRLKSYCNDVFSPERIWVEFKKLGKHNISSVTDCLGRSMEMMRHAQENMERVLFRNEPAKPITGRRALGWPLPNVWLGVSTEDQRRADERVPDLLATPAAVRFVSAEPLLGPIDFNRIHESGETEAGGDWQSWESALNGKRFDIWSDGDVDGCPKLDWIIVGGESGTGARPMHPQWARSIRDQCAAAGVSFHFKQWGEWREVDLDREAGQTKWMIIGRDGYQDIPDDRGPDSDIGEVAMTIVGKKAAGRLLDGIEHNGMPPSRNLHVPSDEREIEHV